MMSEERGMEFQIEQIPEDRRKVSEAHVAALSATARRVAAELPLTADVDDFCRVLIAETNGEVGR